MLVTGGLGYIGSHTVVSLLDAGYEVIIIDNLSNSHLSVLKRINNICLRKASFIEGDIRNRTVLNQIFNSYNIDAVIHFAGLKSVDQSISSPISYYDNNVVGTLALLEEMLRHDVMRFIFSSSATVYGSPKSIPIKESNEVGHTTNPYGTSKLIIEKILSDICYSNSSFRCTILRYFNPVGAHTSGLLGEDPRGKPNNLMPYICQTAIGKLNEVHIFGNDYNTHDGTGVRDYIHVMDLAEGHVAAVKASNEGENCKIYNLGTGKGYSVLDLIKTFEQITNVAVPHIFVGRRPGDIAECWSDPSKAYEELNWRAKKDLADMIRDAWKWQVQNPNGYSDD
ncbi:UDP-glucose 4-epimerase GalE [Escherichia coli]|uniref:UDP-glucose 4-epimerase GalE n=1 Tax=Escherichia coli TaxID=562 RepID=UPI0022649869|nr:UDP-glucose 4-epimerase GalE [Escherichia coli]